MGETGVGQGLTSTPESPKIFHITHVGNLPEIVREGGLWSDAGRLQRGLECRLVGMSSIKQRRLSLPVKSHPGTMVGEYVPFYFCPRSVMLYILHMANHPEVTYRDGQRPIVHLVADLRRVVAWAEPQRSQWAFSNRNAGTYYADFYSDLGELGQINWAAVTARDFRDAVVKEGKQAEFLLHEFFPWELVEAVGVLDEGVAAWVRDALQGASYQPSVQVQPAWYF